MLQATEETQPLFANLGKGVANAFKETADSTESIIRHSADATDSRSKIVRRQAKIGSQS
jgi:hypothetical protein